MQAILRSRRGEGDGAYVEVDGVDGVEEDGLRPVRARGLRCTMVLHGYGTCTEDREPGGRS